MLHAAHYASCLNLKEELTKIGLGHDWLIGSKESLVHRARNEMTASFLETDFTHMMWFDADIEYEAKHVAALWNLDTDIAVGVYPMKKMGAAYAAWVDGKLVTDLDQFEKPIEVEYAGTGFMLLKRSAIESIGKFLEGRQKRAECILKTVSRLLDNGALDLLKEMVDGMSADYEGPGNKRITTFYRTPIWNDIFESEDYHFCRIARMAGFKIIMDPSVRLKHWGQYAFGS